MTYLRIIAMSVVMYGTLLCHGEVLSADTVSVPSSLDTVSVNVSVDSLFSSMGDAENMTELVVTATRTPRLLKDAPILTRVIGRRDIEMADATDLRDLLQQELAGVEFTYSMNQRVNMNLSGFSGQSVLILVDGERMAGETMENVDFSRVDMNNVERIEILRGAQSALYGAGAVGGVINIITRENSRPWSLNVNARLADHRQQRYGGVLGLSGGRVSNTLDVQHMSEDGYAVCMDYGDDCDFRRVYGGYTWNARDRLSVRVSESLRLTARAGYFFKELNADSDVRERHRDFSGGVSAEWRPSMRDHLSVSLSYDQFDKSDLLRLWKRDVLDYRNLQMSVRGIYNRKFRQGDVLSVGGDLMRDYLSTYQFSDGMARMRYTGDLFAQYDWLPGGGWELVGAVRWDCISEDQGTGSHATGKVSARYIIGDLTLRAGYAGGFRAPTLKERYTRFNMVGDIYVLGNESLRSELSHNMQLSAEYRRGSCCLSASASWQSVTDRIGTSAPRQDEMGGQYIRYVNLPHVSVLGVELMAVGEWTVGRGHRLMSRIAYAYTGEWYGRPSSSSSDVGESDGTSSPTQESYYSPFCPARPHALNVRVDWSREWTRHYGMTFSVVGRVLSAVDYESVEMQPPYAMYMVHNPGYTIWKVQLQNRLGRGVRLNVAVDNIFNYAPRVYYFNSPVTLGVNLMVGIGVDVDRLFRTATR